MRLGMALLLALLGLSGCTSIRSTALNRHNNDAFTKNSTIPYKGVPITIKVPTHLDVEIVETYFLQNMAATEAAENGQQIQHYADLAEIFLDRPNLNVKATPVLTDKVFTVDFKRPVSGSLDYAATLGTDQYFDKITGTVIDRTIEDIAELVTTAAPIVGLPTSERIGSQLDNVIINTRTVAFRRFDINDCDFEQQVMDFVQHHLNACHHCSGAIKPETSSISRPSEGLSSVP